MKAAIYEVRCEACGEMRWPHLPFRPATYTCVRCASVEPSKRAARSEKGKAAAAARKARPKASGDLETA